MKSKGRKFLSALLVSSMVLTSSLGFMPRTAQAADAIYSYTFEYVNQVTKTGDREINVKFATEYTLDGIDTTKFEIVTDSGMATSATIGAVDVDGQNVKVEIKGIDPSETGYTLVIKSGGVQLKGMNFGDIPIQFKSYDITPGFKSIFQDATAANQVFADNKPEEITIHVNSGYVRTLKALNYNELVNWTEIEGTTVNTASVEVEVKGIAGENVQTAIVDGEGKFSAVFSDVSGGKDVIIRAYDASGKLLETVTEKINFNDKGTTFNEEAVRTFDSESYTVRQILEGTEITLNKLVDGLSFDDLDTLQVHYKGVDNFYEAGSEAELAQAMLKLSNLADKAATIKLTDDFSISTELTFKNSELLVIDGMGHTLTGDIKLGDDNDETVKLSNINVVGNVTVNVGSAPNVHAYLTDVAITGGDLVIESGSYSSVYLTRVTVPKMLANNTTDVHVMASTGTAIGTTELQGSKDVKLTMAGGTFGADILDKKSGGTLELKSDKTIPTVFDQLTIDASAVNPEVKLLINTEVTNLVANKDVNINGVSSSVIKNSNTSTAKITYDGFKILDATSDTSKYVAGAHVPDEEGETAAEITIPNSIKNKLRMGGTILEGMNADELDANGASLTFTIIPTGTDPTTLKWNSAITKTQAIALIKTSTVIGDVVGDIATLEVVNGGKTLIMNFADGDAIGSSAITVLDTVDFDATGVVEGAFTPDESVVGTSDWSEAGDFTTLYKPSIDGVSSFVVYPYYDLSVIKIEADVALAAITLDTAAASNMYQYRMNNDLAWHDLATGATDIVGAGHATAGTAGTLQLRVKDGDGSVESYDFKLNEPWFDDGSAVADILAAMVKPEVSRIHLYAEQTYAVATTDLTSVQGAALRDKSEFTFEEYNRTAAVDTTVTIGVNKGLNASEVKTVGQFAAIADGDTTAPVTLVGSAIVNTGGTVANTPDAGDTIALVYGEAMDSAAMGEDFNIVITDGGANDVVTVYKGATSTEAADKVAVITVTGGNYTDADELVFNSATGAWTTATIADDTLTITLPVKTSGTISGATTASTGVGYSAGAASLDAAGNAGAAAADVAGANTGF